MASRPGRPHRRSILYLVVADVEIIYLETVIINMQDYSSTYFLDSVGWVGVKGLWILMTFDAGEKYVRNTYVIRTYKRVSTQSQHQPPQSQIQPSASAALQQRRKDQQHERRVGNLRRFSRLHVLGLQLRGVPGLRPTR